MILETGYDEKNTSMYGIIVMMILINCLMEEMYYGWIDTKLQKKVYDRLFLHYVYFNCTRILINWIFFNCYN